MFLIQLDGKCSIWARGDKVFLRW